VKSCLVSEFKNESTTARLLPSSSNVSCCLSRFLKDIKATNAATQHKQTTAATTIGHHRKDSVVALLFVVSAAVVSTNGNEESLLGDLVVVVNDVVASSFDTVFPFVSVIGFDTLDDVVFVIAAALPDVVGNGFGVGGNEKTIVVGCGVGCGVVGCGVGGAGVGGTGVGGTGVGGGVVTQQ